MANLPAPWIRTLTDMPDLFEEVRRATTPRLEGQVLGCRIYTTPALPPDRVVIRGATGTVILHVQTGGSDRP